MMGKGYKNNALQFKIDGKDEKKKNYSDMS